MSSLIMNPPRSNNQYVTLFLPYAITNGKDIRPWIRNYIDIGTYFCLEIWTTDVNLFYWIALT